MSKKPKKKYKKKQYNPPKDAEFKEYKPSQQKFASVAAKVIVVALAVVMFIAFMPNLPFM